MAYEINLTRKNQLGRIVKFHRERAGLSKLELAKLTGISKTVIYDMENGKWKIHIDTLLKLFDAMGIAILLESPWMNQYEGNSSRKRR